MMIDPLVLIGAIGTILSGVVGAGIKKVWVWGWVYKDKDDDLIEMTKDRNFWRDTALALVGINERAIEVAAAKRSRDV